MQAATKRPEREPPSLTDGREVSYHIGFYLQQRKGRTHTIMNVAKVALIGYGTIGTGVARILVEHRSRIERAVGRPVELVRVVDKDVTTPRPVTLPEGVLTDDLDSVVNDPEISCVVQLIGGLEPARTFMLRFLEAGKSVVTANKALLATHGKELFAKAREKGVSIAFEAAVGGGIPVIAGNRPIAGGESDSGCSRHSQRDEQFHPQPDGGSRRGLRLGGGRGPASGICGSRSDDGRRRNGRRPETGHLDPPLVRL